MNPFIRNDQYNFIKNQTQILINGHLSVNDQGVINALKSLAKEKVLALFEDLSEEQANLLQSIVEVKEKVEAEVFLEQIKQFVIPFKEINEQTIKKIFPKAKKLKIPAIEKIDFKEITYLGWIDKGSNKKILILEHNSKHIGISGGFYNSNKKGICSLCNRFEEIGMFTSAIKGTTQDAYISRGNYICQDSQKCNQNLMSLDKLDEFFNLIVGR
ncbi:elongation factor G-binding protein [Psychrobacillus glaciei]|uniref:Elongation factor G-binding protein n=1 Tax=Psychrobacillus glaciei TaxID=2283160 RepID=A0A5J6SQL0_9BACI|nr:FusB/FusC family EF-G-binding protein [Psychrobacillus glaciei]QFG00242.1 elongation factor G-binding protein [Psychrobacillus glaciei]